MNKYGESGHPRQIPLKGLKDPCVGTPLMMLEKEIDVMYDMVKL